MVNRCKMRNEFVTKNIFATFFVILCIFSPLKKSILYLQSVLLYFRICLFNPQKWHKGMRCDRISFSIAEPENQLTMFKVEVRND